ncbi:MAG: response regulator transcription factor, partial [Bacteroidales bacterium]|nr:response regulator transcription factor [Bacteroidales bacterium]
NEGFDVTCANSAEEALEKITPDCALILLDVMMGGMSGFKMAEKLRKKNNHTPIIFITAKDTENDMLTGFSVGADDYIYKPFSVKEVTARVKAVLKRHSNDHQVLHAPNENKLMFDNLEIDFQTKEVFIKGDSITLTKTEFEILTLLASNPNRLFSREDMIEYLWKDAPYVTERTVDVHITRLRKKLGDMANLISSRSGYGYRFNSQIS